MEQSDEYAKEGCRSRSDSILDGGVKQSKCFNQLERQYSTKARRAYGCVDRSVG